MLTSDFDYSLPDRLIAQAPRRRGVARLLVVDRQRGELRHRRFANLEDELQPGDLLVLNDTRVTARRLFARKSTGGEVELLLVAPTGPTTWHGLVRPAKRLPHGTVVCADLDGTPVPVTIGQETPDGGRQVHFASAEASDRARRCGSVPLPPYIHIRPDAYVARRYQTVYARTGSSAAAPTAGLHFTSAHLQRLGAAGIDSAKVTLDIGVDTFRPVKTTAIADHQMHGECAAVSESAAESISRCRGRVVAVGTTVVRALETAACEADGQRVRAWSGETRLFITPGHRFRSIDALLTNLHLPKSTLLMLVSAFGGTDLIRHAYREAVRLNYAFYSFGDAMLVL